MHHFNIGKILGKLLLYLFLVQFSTAFSQSDEINLDKYWKLRHRFLEKFVKIGPGNGESLPAGALVPGACIDNIASDGTDPAKWQKTEYGEMHWGDGMIRHGHYLGLLATEYALKKKYNKDVTGVLNELYYALNAINRLDKKAEVELNHIYGTQFTENLNGFYLREDVPEDFCLNWKDEPMNFGCTNSAFYENNNVGKLNDPEKNYQVKSRTSYQNVPSMDQMSSLIIGLSLVHKLVDDIYVKPTDKEQGFYIVTEVKNIVQRIVTYASNRNWEIIDVNGWPVANGGGDLAFSAYPYALGASRITGNSVKSYNPYFIRKLTRYHPKYNSIQHCITGFGVAGQQDKQHLSCDDLNPKFFKPTMYFMNKRLSEGALPGVNNNQNSSVYLDWAYRGKSHRIKLSKFLWKNKFLNFVANLSLSMKKSDYPDHRGILSGMESRNQTIIFNLGVTGGYWNSNMAHIFGNKSENRELELVNALLHDRTPTKPKHFYQQYLNGMPFSGPYNLSGKNWTSNEEGPWYEIKSKAENGWDSPHRWRHGIETHLERQGLFNGLDYMLFHNLYYLIFGDELPEFNDNQTCFCDAVSPQITPGTHDEEIREAYGVLNKKLLHVPTASENAFASTFNLVRGEFKISPQFDEYTKMGIQIPKFQTENVYVQGRVVVETDLVICNEKSLEVTHGGTIEVENATLTAQEGSSILVKGSVTISKGSTLVLKPNTTINLAKGARLIFLHGSNFKSSESGTIHVQKGAQVVTPVTDLFNKKALNSAVINSED